MTRLLLQLVTGLALFTAPALAEETASADEMLTLGKNTYRELCSHCHGVDMVNPGTSSYDLRKWPQDNPDGFRESVTNGKGDMPAWGDILTEEELIGLWQYVVTRGGKEPAPEPQGEDNAQLKSADEKSADFAFLEDALMTPGVLTVCLARNGGVMSSKRLNKDGGVGLDYEVAKHVAAELGLDFAVTWFESEPEEDTTAVRETIAMLSYPLCDLSPGFALYQPSLDFYQNTRAALPYWDDRPTHYDRKSQVDLKRITATRPYARMEIGLVLQQDVEVGKVDQIEDLDSLRLGVQQGTLAGILTLHQGSQELVANAVTMNPGPTFLWSMEKGEFEGALVAVGEYDFHKRQNAISKLKLHDYRHPLGFNLGIALLEENEKLLTLINPIIDKLLESGGIYELAERSQMNYARPRQPEIQGRLSMRDILMIR